LGAWSVNFFSSDQHGQTRIKSKDLKRKIARILHGAGTTKAKAVNRKDREAKATKYAEKP
jgi:hypothetical protein